MPLKIDQLVKFTTSARYGEWNKHDLAKISDILVIFPDNQVTLYYVRPIAQDAEYWVYEHEIAPTFEQLSLF